MLAIPQLCRWSEGVSEHCQSDMLRTSASWNVHDGGAANLGADPA